MVQCGIIKVYLMVFVVDPIISQPLSYYRPGNITLGYLTTIRGPGLSLDACAESLFKADRVQYVEAFKYMVDTINNRDDILPNVTLGFAILDDCKKEAIAVSQALRMAPVCPRVSRDQTMPPGGDMECFADVGNFPVVGLVGPRESGMSVRVTSLLSRFKVPVLATFASSDELSDKTRFPYFLRLVPPDRFQADAILDFLLHYNWTYFSLVYSNFNYGINGAQLIRNGAKERGMCIAHTAPISTKTSQEELTSVLEGLLGAKEARVVVMFLTGSHAKGLMELAKANNHEGYFIWVGSDSLFFSGGLNEYANGLLNINFPAAYQKDFFESYLSMTPTTNRQNPWIRDLWEMLYECEWNAPPNANYSCSLYEDKPNLMQSPGGLLAIPMDGVLVYATALHALIQENCPEVFNNIELGHLSKCIDGEQLLQHLKDVEFTGLNGHISFTPEGDMAGQYIIKQHRYQNGLGGATQVAVYDKLTERIYADDNIEWSIYKQVSNFEELAVPESVCSKPCGDKEYKMQLEKTCCWLCRGCRKNEIISNSKNETSCETCPPTTWPDEELQKTCHPIPSTHVQLSDTFAILTFLFSVLGSISWVTTIVIFLKNWDHKLVKASSRELSLIILIGIEVAFLTTLTFIFPPDSILCNIRRIGFSFSVILIFGPLLVKTNRIYRIFTGGKQGIKRIGFISTHSQMVITTIIIIGQGIVCIVVSVVEPTYSELWMPIPTEFYVELYCSVTLSGLLIPLGYNLAVILLTAVHGFLTRKHPENFNESWHIFLCVSTTCFLWAVMLPTYFTTFYAYSRSVLLAACLFLNAVITLLGLYVPKLYALYFVEETLLNVKTQMTTGSINKTGPQRVMVASATEESTLRM